MSALLHILTQPADELVRSVIENQVKQAGALVEVIDLSQPQPDYDLLVEKVFAADSVSVW